MTISWYLFMALWLRVETSYIDTHPLRKAGEPFRGLDSIAASCLKELPRFRLSHWQLSERTFQSLTDQWTNPAMFCV